MAQHFPALVTLFALLLFALTAYGVGRARNIYGIKAPATSGHEVFERRFRVQMNTLENLVLFLPSLWLFAIYVSHMLAGILGVIWLLARSYYVIAYVREPVTRRIGFHSAMLVTVGMAVSAGIAIVIRILEGT